MSKLIRIEKPERTRDPRELWPYVVQCIDALNELAQMKMIPSDRGKVFRRIRHRAIEIAIEIAKAASKGSAGPSRVRELSPEPTPKKPN